MDIVEFKKWIGDDFEYLKYACLLMGLDFTFTFPHVAIEYKRGDTYNRVYKCNDAPIMYVGADGFYYTYPKTPFNLPPSLPSAPPQSPVE